MPFNFICIKFTSKLGSLMLTDGAGFSQGKGRVREEASGGFPGAERYPASCARLSVHRCVHFARIQSEAWRGGSALRTLVDMQKT